MQVTVDKLSPIQLELLKVYSFQPSEEDLVAIKGLLANYFAKKLVKNIDSAVKEHGITGEHLNNWLNEKA
jgi:hypothetical protein